MCCHLKSGIYGKSGAVTNDDWWVVGAQSGVCAHQYAMQNLQQQPLAVSSNAAQLAQHIRQPVGASELWDTLL